MVRACAAWTATILGKGLATALAGALLAAVLSALGCAVHAGAAGNAQHGPTPATQVTTAQELHWIWTGTGPGAPPGWAREDRILKVENSGLELEKAGKFRDAVKVYQEALRMSDSRSDQASEMADLARVYARQHKSALAVHEAHAAIATALAADFPFIVLPTAGAAALAEARVLGPRWHCTRDAALARLAAENTGDTRTVYSLARGVNLIRSGQRSAGLAVLRGIRAGPRLAGFISELYASEVHDAARTQSLAASHRPLSNRPTKPGLGH